METVLMRMVVVKKDGQTGIRGQHALLHQTAVKEIGCAEDPDALQRRQKWKCKVVVS